LHLKILPQIEKLTPQEQVELLISTLEKGQNIIPLVDGLERRYKTYQDFVNTKDHQAFENEQLIELVLKGLKRDEESSVLPLSILIKLICRIGSSFVI
jgi:hypothetical protein